MVLFNDNDIDKANYIRLFETGNDVSISVLYHFKDYLFYIIFWSINTDKKLKVMNIISLDVHANS